jgi:hypothetical protein
METRKQNFSTGTRDPDGQNPALNYNRVFVVLPAGADTTPFAADYTTLKGNIPKDPTNRDRPERYCHQSQAPISGGAGRAIPAAGDVAVTPGTAGAPEFTSCSGDPSCNGGPLPAASKLQAAHAAQGATAIRDATAESAPRTPDLLPRFRPGDCVILLKKSVTWCKDRPSYLCDPSNNNKTPILVRNGTSRDGLDGWLTGYCRDLGIKTAEIAFHMYEAPLPPALLTSRPPVAGEENQPQWLIAVPVLHASAMDNSGAAAAAPEPSEAQQDTQRTSRQAGGT